MKIAYHKNLLSKAGQFDQNTQKIIQIVLVRSLGEPIPLSLLPDDENKTLKMMKRKPPRKNQIANLFQGLSRS